GNRIVATGYSLQNGIGTIIRQKQKKLAAKEDLIVLIKPLSSASYQNVLTALDDMQINRVQQYAIVEASQEEKAFVLHR
ncbi:MAG TPA: hypothetical protein VFL47_03185, partial [Flavisolibacter sp.]|nr:hypothetical protein [Flavisolibacter sp.]